MVLPEIHSQKDIENLIEEFGFLPFFKNRIPGFSIAECCPKELWFVEGTEGPWEWKGPIITNLKCAYGKFLNKKACYISKKWFPDFANFRRDGYDFETLVDIGMARNRDIGIMHEISSRKSILSKDLKYLHPCDKKSQYEEILSHLQMQCYILTANFDYQLDKNGLPYGFGLARYATPENFFGNEFSDTVYSKEPEESKNLIIEHLVKKLNVNENEIIKLIS